MSNNSAPIVDRIRIIPRPDDFLDRNVGSSGEVFFNGATSSLRVYSGKDRSGFELARADLTNIDETALNNKLIDLGYSVSQGGGNTSITVSDSAPTDAEEGQLWFDTDTGVLFVYFGQWIQPSSPGSSGSTPSGSSYTDAQAISAITSNDLDMGGNKVLFGNVYAELADLPDASTYHGMFAHVHSTGKGYFAHAGSWVQLANAADIVSGGGGTTVVSGASVSVSSTVPVNPESGNLWLDTNTGKLFVYVDDGDSGQWMQPAAPSFPLLATVATSGSYTDLTDKPALATVATSGSYNDLIDKPVLGEGGFDGAFSSLSGVPTTLAGYGLTSIGFDLGESINEFSSDVALADSSDTAVPTENAVKSYVDGKFSNARLTGTVQLANIDSNGNDINISSGLGGQIITIGTAAIDGFDSIVLNGLTTLETTSEKLNTLTGTTGTVDHDLNDGAVFNHTNLVSDFTVNFTNVPTTDDRTISAVLILNQSTTAYIPTALEIDGVSQTIKWQGASAPTGNASQVDIVSFTLIRSSSAWSVIGNLTTYG
jgi:hypothetical protein